ncbi:twin-arginine translocation signal domain-containing protein [Candidatus Pacearchaeota archaeon]|nr:twin-arginine translocation signal domain-containing protein [Candidatus Pacearchaeota archaeon]
MKNKISRRDFLKQGAGIIGGVLASGLITNCQMPFGDMEDWYNLSKSEIPTILRTRVREDNGNYFFRWIEGDTALESELGKYINLWMDSNLVYEYYLDKFQPARATLEDGKGNSARQALLRLALAYNLTDGNVKGDLVPCWNNSPFHGGFYYASRINGKLNKKSITDIYDVIPFDEIADYTSKKQ